jgi:photosystem II stability/assembly factor-like uncharacterized protein
MDEEPSPGISERGRRGLKVILVAALVIVASSLAWLYPSMAAKTNPGSAPVPAPLPMTRAGDFVTYQFVDTSVGWAVGVGYGSRDPGRYWVAQTVDGAQHWQTRFRGQVSARFGGPSSIQFFDRTYGFAAIGLPLELIRTVDGVNWTKVQLPDDGASVTFSDRRHGWLLAGAYPTQITPDRQYATDDGGDSWRRLPDPPGGSYQLAFRSPREGWASTRNLGSRSKIYLSVDGGQTWQSRDIPEPPGRPPDQTQVVGALRLLPGIGVIALVAFSDGRRFQDFQELTSFDLGRTWTPVVPPVQSNGLGIMRQDSFEDATHWWAVDGGGLYKSPDAGQSWKLILAKLENSDNWLYSIQVLDSMHAFSRIGIGQVTGLVVTNDGGLHWARVNVPEPAS